jgi:hypothetical protein
MSLILILSTVPYNTVLSAIIDRVKGFFTTYGIEDGEMTETVSSNYKIKVTSCYPGDEFHACCLWLKNLGAFDDSDLERIASARSHRNKVSHEIVKFIAEPGHTVSEEHLTEIYRIVKKLDIYWVTEVDMATDPDVSKEAYDAAKRGEAVGGYSLLLEIILPVFKGDWDSLLDLHNELEKHA